MEFGLFQNWPRKKLNSKCVKWTDFLNHRLLVDKHSPVSDFTTLKLVKRFRPTFFIHEKHLQRGFDTMQCRKFQHIVVFFAIRDQARVKIVPAEEQFQTWQLHIFGTSRQGDNGCRAGHDFFLHESMCLQSVSATLRLNWWDLRREVWEHASSEHKDIDRLLDFLGFAE
jgi:hypothetical protein